MSLAPGVQFNSPAKPDSAIDHSLLLHLETAYDHPQYVACIGFRDRFQCTMTWDDVTRTLTVAPLPFGHFEIDQFGIRYTKTAAESVTITNTEGLWYFYYDLGVLTASQAIWFLDIIVPVCIVYWDSANGRAIHVAEERHSNQQAGIQHSYEHYTFGTRYETGLDLGGYTTVGTGALDTDAQFGVGAGEIWDEDVRITIVDAAVPANEWEQDLSAPAKIPIFYRSGPANDWRRKDADAFPLVQGGLAITPAFTRIAYNDAVLGVYQLLEANNAAHVAIFLVATNDINHPVIAILGQRQDQTLGVARTLNAYQNLNLLGLPFREMRVLFRVIFQTSNGYGNAVKARIVEAQDLRAIDNLPAGQYVPVTHGGLVGLSDNDHPQYWLNEGPVLRPPEITANQNDYRPTDIDESAVLLLTSDGSYDLTGIYPYSAANIIDGRKLVIINANAAGSGRNFTLKESSGLSAFTYRMLMGGDQVLTPTDCIRLIYDATATNWRRAT